MSDHPKVAIFWDYENCSPPSNSCGLGYDIVNNVRRIARIFGSVTAFRAYLDISAQSPKSVVLRSELQSSGVSMIDCPHNGKKDVVDKMILVDMLAFAIDHPTPATVMLITGDRDYAYAVSVLKLRKYHVILVVPSSPHVSPSLENQASLVIDWGVTILRNRTEAISSTHAVRQPYFDLDPTIVAKLLRELQDLSPDDSDATLPANSQCTSRLRRVSARDLLEPSKHSKNTGSIDSTQEFIQVPSSPTGIPASTVIDPPLGGLPIPRTPSRPRQASVSTASTRVRSATNAAQLPLASEKEVPPKNPPFSGASDFTDMASPTKSNLSLPPLDAAELHVHDNCLPSSTIARPTGAMPLSGNSGTHPSRGLNCLASPFILAKAPTGLASALKPASPIMAPTGTLADTATTYGTLEDIAVPKETEHLTIEDSDGSSGQSSPYRMRSRASARNPTNTLRSNYRPHSASPSMYSPSSRNMELRSANGTSSGNQASPPEAMFLGVVDDDDSDEPASSSRASSALGHSAPDSVSAHSSAVPSDPFTTIETQRDESERRRKSTMFRSLIQLLLEARENGIGRPSRSTIAMELVQSDKHVYQRVGALRFRDYTALAEQAGVIQLGGIGADAWIALHPDWFRVDGMTTAHLLSSRVSSPTSDPPDGIRNSSLTGSMTSLMAGSQPLTAPPPRPRPSESNNTVPTLAFNRQDGAVRASGMPTQFQPLIDALVRMRAEGSAQALRSLVGQSLGQDVYAQAGVPGFREYVLQATERQLVQCGGVGGNAWIRLHPELRI